MPDGGLPHSEIIGSRLGSSSPMLFAAAHVLRRHSTPRHPPHACHPSSSVPCLSDASLRPSFLPALPHSPRSVAGACWDRMPGASRNGVSPVTRGLVVSSLQLERCKTRLQLETDWGWCHLAQHSTLPALAPARKGGGDAGSRTPCLLRAKQALFQLSYIPALVGHPGLEPGASVLSGLRSHHLS